jgi:hypothetical protein
MVKALQTLRGVSLICATITVAELGGLSRFQNLKEFMAYLGLVQNIPAVKLSAGRYYKNRQRPCPQSTVRRGLDLQVSCASHAPLNKTAAGITENYLPYLLEGATASVCPYRKMVARKKPNNVVVIAIARELAAFMEAIAKEVRAAA